MSDQIPEAAARAGVAAYTALPDLVDSPDDVVRTILEAAAPHLPCGWCKGSGNAPEETFGRDADGAPQVEGDQPCPEGCRPPVSDQTPADLGDFERCGDRSVWKGCARIKDHGSGGHSTYPLTEEDRR